MSQPASNPALYVLSNVLAPFWEQGNIFHVEKGIIPMLEFLKKCHYKNLTHKELTFYGCSYNFVYKKFWKPSPMKKMTGPKVTKEICEIFKMVCKI